MFAAAFFTRVIVTSDNELFGVMVLWIGVLRALLYQNGDMSVVD